MDIDAATAILTCPITSCRCGSRKRRRSFQLKQTGLCWAPGLSSSPPIVRLRVSENRGC